MKQTCTRKCILRTRHRHKQRKKNPVESFWMLYSLARPLSLSLFFEQFSFFPKIVPFLAYLFILFVKSFNNLVFLPLLFCCFLPLYFLCTVCHSYVCLFVIR